MNVSLTPELDEWVNEKVKGGLYSSSSEVVREGLRLLKDREEQKQAVLHELRDAVRVGVKQLETGRSHNLNNRIIQEVKRKAREKVTYADRKG